MLWWWAKVSDGKPTLEDCTLPQCRRRSKPACKAASTMPKHQPLRLYRPPPAGNGGTFLYNTATRKWTQGAARPFAGHHIAAEVINNKLYLFGGLKKGGNKVRAMRLTASTAEQACYLPASCLNATHAHTTANHTHTHPHHYFPPTLPTKCAGSNLRHQHQQVERRKGPAL